MLYTRTDTPRIYVASLADYNAGTLHGRWIDADQDADSIHEDVKAMLAESREPFAEEWAIHDYEGFGGWKPGEWESFETVAAVGEALAEHGDALGAWLANDEYNARDLIDNGTDRFQECYRGVHKNGEDYAYDFYQETTVDGLGPLESYIDWQSVYRDMDEWDAPAAEGGIHVFANY